MSEGGKLNLPAIRKGRMIKVPQQKVSQKKMPPLDLDKNREIAEAMSRGKTVKEEITQREQGLDLVLVGDLTGSMGQYHALLRDKFSELSQDLLSMIRNLKIGIIFYLDHGSNDPYVTRICQLTKNFQEIESFIHGTSAGCGGDDDEALEDALHDVVNLNWRESGNRSVVLFGDARPHEPGECPDQYSYFDLTRRMFNNKIVVNSVYCGPMKVSADTLQRLENTDVGDFSRKVSRLEHPHFFSWIANVTGGMIIGVEQIDDLIEIIKAAAAKDSGNLDEYEKELKKKSPSKLNLVHIAKRANKRLEEKRADRLEDNSS